MSRFNVMPRKYRRLWKPSLLDRLLRRKPPTVTYRPTGQAINEPLTPDNHPDVIR